MGAWGTGSFENDDAGDWVWELADAENTTILQDAFDRITEADDYLEAPDCSIAIAAAEVIAALRQRPLADLPEEVTDYVTRIGTPPSSNLISAALAALKIIKTKSELQELWEESDSATGWLQTITDLENRLK